MKFGTLLSGGELAGVGITAAGWEHAWGNELEPEIAAVANSNGFNVSVGNVLDADPRRFEPVDALHASPVCTRASGANQSAELNNEGTKEAPLDIAMGRKVAEFIDVLAPRVVTVENVYAYRNFKAFKLICAALTKGGYLWSYSHENAADYGVPQTRRRLILRAVKVGRLAFGMKLPTLPAPVPWVGWYAAIEDLLPTLPTSEFAPWQLARLPEVLNTTLVAQGGYGDNIVTVDRCDPAFAVTANGNQTGVRAYIIGDQYGEPAGTPNRRLQILEGAQPAPVVRTYANGGNVPRAFIMPGSGNTNLADAEPGGGVPYAATPAHTVGSDGGGRIPRAFLVDGKLSTSGENKILQINDADTPSGTVVASHTAFRDARAWLSAGRVVAMTPRALARFQSLPDWYKLPDRAALACKIIGNGVPCLLMQRIYEGLRP